MGLFDWFPYTNFHELNLDWILSTVKKSADTAENTKTFVDGYFKNLNVTAEIAEKLDAMAESGELQNIVSEYLEVNASIVFQNVADMADSDSLVAGSTAHTLGFYNAGDGGAAFYKVVNYTTEYAENGFTVIPLQNPALCAVLVSDCANVKQYGARADGVTDDSAVFNLAFNSGKNVIVPQGQYYINSPISVKSRIISGVAVPVSGSVIILGRDGVFNIQKDDTFIENILFTSNIFDNDINGINAIVATGIGLDVDLNVQNCVFRYIENPVTVSGRGLQMDNCAFVHCVRCVSYNYEGSGDTNNPLTDRISGGRGFKITNCRFHSVHGLGQAIYMPATSVTVGALITDNVMDLGQGSFVEIDGVLYNAIITNNVASYCTTAPFKFNNAVERCTIADNTIYCDNARIGLSGLPSNLMTFSGGVKACQIMSNQFCGCLNAALRFVLAVIHTNIDGNIFQKVARNGYAGGCIRSENGISNSRVCGNIVSDMYTENGFLITAPDATFGSNVKNRIQGNIMYGIAISCSASEFSREENTIDL